MSKVYKQLSELGEIITGKTPPTANYELWDGSIPFITPTDIKGFDSFYQGVTERTVSQLGVSKQRKTLLPKNSVCVSCIATIGKMCLTKCPSITNQQINSIIPNEGNDYRYILYMLRYNLPYIQLVGGGSGSGTPIISKNKFGKFKFLVEEDLPTQRRIASILSAYDNLIENNNKRIRLLEQMAENLYKEWFVRFRFPGHEKVEMVNGLPKGWKNFKADEHYIISIGKTPPRKEFEWFTKGDSTAQNWLSISDMNGPFVSNTDEQITQAAVRKFNMVVAPKNSILMSFKLTVGRVAIAAIPLCTNEAIAHFKKVPNTEREFLYLQLKQYEYSSLGNTSAIGNAINSKIVKAMPLILPSEDVLTRFHSVMKPIFDSIEFLMKKNALLARQRDLLLPRLMSGKLEVKG